MYERNAYFRQFSSVGFSSAHVNTTLGL